MDRAPKEPRLVIPHFDDDTKIRCIHCDFSEHVEAAVYCQQCGTLLQNYCENPQCSVRVDDDEDVELPQEALFCPYCGEATMFNRLGILAPQNAQ